jgi:flagellar basal body-associated protein FliL
MDRNISIMILLMIALVSFALSACISSIEFNSGKKQADPVRQGQFRAGENTMRNRHFL